MSLFKSKKSDKETKGKPAKADKKAVGNKQRSRRKRRSGALWLIITMFVLSGVLRFGGGPGRALAEDLVHVVASDETGHGEETAASDEACGEGIADVLALIKEREARVAEREAAVEQRMQALALAEEQVRENLLALESAEASLKSTMALSSTAAEEDLARLTMVYENMKPKDAAAVFSTMDPQFAAGFLGRMRADAAAAIMAGLNPDTAYAISVLLAGRNANAPTE